MLGAFYACMVTDACFDSTTGSRSVRPRRGDEEEALQKACDYLSNSSDKSQEVLCVFYQKSPNYLLILV